MLFQFKCETIDCVYNLSPCFLVDASDRVLCGGCKQFGTAIQVEQPPEEPIALD